jgi:hypothetical protein
VENDPGIAGRAVDFERFPPLNEGEIKRIVLERWLVSGEYTLMLEHLRDPQIEVYLDHSLRAMRLQIRGHIWSDRVGEHEYRYPATWWDHLKLALPPWLRRRMTIRYQVHTLEARALYPEFVPTVSRQPHRLILHEILGRRRLEKGGGEDVRA